MIRPVYTYVLTGVVAVALGIVNGLHSPYPVLTGIASAVFVFVLGVATFHSDLSIDGDTHDE